MELVKQKLEETITKAFDDLENLEVGSQEYTHAVNGIRELYKLKIEEQKLENESIEAKRHEKEVRLKRAQLQVDKQRYEEEIRVKREQLISDKQRYEDEIRVKREQLRSDERRHEDEIRVKETQVRNEEKRSKRIKPDVILSCLSSLGMIVGILLYEKSDVLTTKAVNYVPKIKM